MEVIFIGDVVGKPGRISLKSNLPKYRDLFNPDLIIANVENAAGGTGITEKIYHELKECGVDVMTSGNHIWDQKDVFNFIDSCPDLIRPANYPSPATPGKGFCIAHANGYRIAVLNIMGQVFISEVNCPFQSVTQLLEHISHFEPDAIIIDFHAEATSEKQAMGWHLDGQVSAVIGTHTHVQTTDQRILPCGTAYLTDVGMVGLYNSIIGVDIEGPLQRFITKMPYKFEISKGPTQFNAVYVKFDKNTGKALTIETIRKVD